MPFDINRGAKVIPFPANSDRAKTPRVEPVEPVTPASSDLVEVSVDVKPRRSAGDYSAAELAAMRPDDRELIQCTRIANRFVAWCEDFERKHGRKPTVPEMCGIASKG
jgi:hypothetical protein